MENFNSSSPEVTKIQKGLRLTKTLLVSSLIAGEKHTGKKTLIKDIFPDAFWIDAKDIKEVKKALGVHQEIVLSNFDSSLPYNESDFYSKRVIAICDDPSIIKKKESLFSFVYLLPPLRERPSDVKILAKKFIGKANEIMGNDIEIDMKNLDISENIKSLKKSIYKEVFSSSLDENEIKSILYNYFYNAFDDENGYRELSEIFERPLIEAGLKKYKSQLKLASILKINRNTLRKKIYELGIN
ncbi:MAG: Fis family transcriptional regulator [Campylobacterales bacterium]|nr:Fis family transcriptional regulator [Campylobacterales bacterium]